MCFHKYRCKAIIKGAIEATLALEAAFPGNVEYDTSKTSLLLEYVPPLEL